MRIADKFWGAILQRVRQSDRRRTQCSYANHYAGDTGPAGAAAYSTTGEFVAGVRDSAFGGGRNDFDSGAGTAVPAGVGNGRTILELAVHVSAVRAVWDRGDRWIVWRGAAGVGVGAVSTRALGATAWFG